MDVSFILCVLAMCTIFQGWRFMQAIWEIIFGNINKDMEQFDPLQIIGQIVYILVYSFGAYLLINLKGII